MHIESLEQRHLLTASLVADFNAEPAGIEQAFQSPVRVQDSLFITIHTKEYGNEIWKTDGTPDGTGILKDIAPGNADSFARSLVEFENNLYFVASDGDSSALYRSDGTSEGTRSFHQLTSKFHSAELTVFDENLYFVTASSTRGTALWSSDGTTEGTQIAMDGLNAAGELIVVGDSLVIPTTTTSQSGLAIILDEDGTTREQALATGDNVFSPVSSVRTFGHQLVALTTEGIWVSDLQNEPRMVEDQTYSGVHSVEFNGELFFPILDSVSPPSEFPEFNVELWKTDLVSDAVIATDRAGWPLGVLDDRLYFATFDAERTQLWSTDGTPDSEELAFESDGLIDIFRTTFFQEFGDDAIYLSIIADRTSRTSDSDIWEITADSTELIGTFDQSSSALGRIDDKVLLLGDDGIHGLEFWVYDAQDSSLELLKDANPGSANSSFGGFSATSDRLFFTDFGGTSWALEGTQRTRMSREGIPSRSSVVVVHPFGDHVMIDVFLPGSAREFWIWDGSLDTATKLFSFVDNPMYRSASTVEVAGDNHFLVLEEDIWFTDGTAAGSRSLRDIAPQIDEEWKIRGDSPTPTLGNEIYFVITDPDQVSQLWRTNGTEAGTEMVYQLSVFDVTFDSLTATDSFVYFVTQDLDGIRLLRTNGDVTSLVTRNKELVGGIPLFPGLLGIPAFGRHLGVSDGVYLTLGGLSGEVWFVDDVSGVATPVLSDLPRGLQILQAKAVGAKLFFILDDNTLSDEEKELWVSDGTPEGTKKIRNLQVESYESLDIVKAGGTYYFAADDGVSGKELWGTDGTPEGTFSYDINPGISSSYPQSLTANGDELYFTATTTLHGRELWKVSGPPPTPSDLNRDGEVSFADFLIFRRHINGTENSSTESDLNGDGTVDFADFLILSDNFGFRQEPPVSTAPLIPEVVDLVAAADPFDEDEFSVPLRFPLVF